MRIANSDDVIFSRLGLSQDSEALSAHWSRESLHGSRFYYALFPFKASNASFHIANPVAFASIRAALFFAQFALLGWLLARLTANGAIGWLFFLASLCAIHISPIFNCVLSHPEYAVGTCALILSLHAYVNYISTSRRAWRIAACFGYAWALLNHENFVVFFPLYWAMDWLTGSGQRTVREVIFRSWPLLAVLALYIAIYLGFRASYPSTYGGTQFSLDLRAAGTAWCRLNLTAVPGVELLLARHFPAPEEGPLFKGPQEMYTVVAHAPLNGIVLAFLAAIAAARLVPSALEGSLRPSIRALACLAWAVAASNLLISFTCKYQVLIHRRYFPYYYGISVYCWAIATAVCALACLPRLREQLAKLPWALWILPFFVLFASASASNAETVRKLIAWYN